MTKNEKDVQGEVPAQVDAPEVHEITWKQLVTWLKQRKTELESDDAKARLNNSFRLGQLDVVAGLVRDFEQFDNTKE